MQLAIADISDWNDWQLASLDPLICRDIGRSDSDKQLGVDPMGIISPI